MFFLLHANEKSGTVFFYYICLASCKREKENTQPICSEQKVMKTIEIKNTEILNLYQINKYIWYTLFTDKKCDVPKKENYL